MLDRMQMLHSQKFPHCLSCLTPAFMSVWTVITGAGLNRHEAGVRRKNRNFFALF